MDKPQRQDEQIPTDEIKIPCEVYSRIVGYLRPLQNWNEGKQQEFRDRRMFRIVQEGAEPSS